MSLVPKLAQKHAPKPAIVLLCTPRSFSSVTNAMLGCHPALAALPEQNLFLADTLGDLIKLEDEFGPQRGYLAGTKRAIASLEFGAQDEPALHEAERWLRRRWFWRSGRMFDWLRQKAAPRALVYKSPRSAMSQAATHRMLAANPGAKFLHLIREPGAAIADWAASSGQRSIEANRFFAEIWAQSHKRMCDIAGLLPAACVFTVKGEDVVNQPVKSMRCILDWLDLDASQHILESMLHPEHWPFACPLPTLHACDNDEGFLEHPQLRPTPEPRLSVEALALDAALTRELLRLGQALGYSC